MKNLAFFVFLVLPFISLFGQDSSTNCQSQTDKTLTQSENNIVPTGNNWVNYQVTVEQPTILSKVQFVALISAESCKNALPDMDVFFEINGKPLIITEDLPLAKATNTVAPNIAKYEIAIPADLITLPRGNNTVKVSFYPKQHLSTENFEYVCSITSKYNEGNNMIFGYSKTISVGLLNGNESPEQQLLPLSGANTIVAPTVFSGEETVLLPVVAN